MDITANGVAGEDVLRFDPDLVALSDSDASPDAGETVGIGRVVIGTIAAGGDGESGNPPEVALTAEATPERAETLLRAMVYENTAATPPTLSREVSVALTDGDGGSPDTQTVTVGVQVPADVIYEMTDQVLSGSAQDMLLGDIDGDGDIDIVSVGYQSPSRVWVNGGTGTFTDSGQMLESALDTWAAVLGDVDGDGDLDIVATTKGGDARVEIWTNDGTAGVIGSGEDLDVTIAFRGTKRGIRIFLNTPDGDGVFAGLRPDDNITGGGRQRHAPRRSGQRPH